MMKLLIANRGEIATRIIRACYDRPTVAVYVGIESDAPHVLAADDEVYIGESYLNADAIIEAALDTHCTAIHPGYGYLSENAEFAEQVRAAGLTFIGPSSDAIATMGSKTAARAAMIAAGVPVVPGYQGEPTDFAAEAQTIGYPIMVKAAAGGGGKGMRIVNTPDELADAITAAQREAKNAFGDDTLFIEKYLPVSHHIEFQILGDTHGNIVHLFERECSIQRRHQKIIEETPSPQLDDTLRAEMGAAAVAAAQAVDYVNAGTVEFILDPDGNFYFLEMNTRLQVEHPITELVTGVDLVRLQLAIAEGEPLPFSPGELTQRGHAIECRLYAEDPANNFLPEIGTIHHLHFPTMPHFRVDAGIVEGDEVGMQFDPMLAKLISYGRTRDEAIGVMRSALQETAVLGVGTNLAFLDSVLAHEAFIEGDTTTRFIAEHQPQPDHPPRDHIALIVAALSESHSQSSEVTKPQEEDVYSPWNVPDHFRLVKG